MNGNRVVKQEPLEELQISADMAGLPAELRPLLDLWEQRREAGGHPLRASLTPRDLKAWLPAIHVYEVVENQRFTARLLGTAIVNAIGADQTGRTFGEHDRDLLATRAYKVLSQVVGQGTPIRTKAPRIAAVKQSWHAAESLWLPLGAGREVQQVLAATILTTLG
jgi:hypothetical protein